MKIYSADFLKSSAEISQCPEADIPEFAFIGRSNVGKSSLINMLVERRSMAKTSGTPGKTRLINHFIINQTQKPWYLVDLPGFGYAKIAQSERAKWKKMVRTYIEDRQNLRCTFLLIDVRLEPQKIDLEFAQWLGENGLPFALIFTKADKEKPGAVERNVNLFADKFLETFSDLPNLFISSAETRLGRDKILGFIESVIQA